jgi:ABC-type glutathione transport system ATPase component
VLAVPVVALLALPKGGFGVEVVDGARTRIVPVRTGMFAAGQVEVSGRALPRDAGRRSEVSSSPEPIVILRGVRREYPGGVTALREVDLGIGRGELVAIVGPSGSGKTTLLNVMGTLDSPSAGDVVVDGFEVAGLSDRELSALRARRIGFVFQHFHLAPGVSLSSR